MATPTYDGTGQPIANSGWLSGVGSWFGAAAPVYASAPVKPAVSASPPQATGTLGATPAVGVVASCDPDRITLVIPRELIDTQQLAASASQDGDVSSCDVSSCDAERITLVIPRSLLQSQP